MHEINNLKWRLFTLCIFYMTQEMFNVGAPTNYCRQYVITQHLRHQRGVTQDQFFRGVKLILIFNLQDWLGKKGERAQSVLLFPHNWRENGYIHAFLEGIIIWPFCICAKEKYCLAVIISRDQASLLKLFFGLILSKSENKKDLCLEGLGKDNV